MCTDRRRFHIGCCTLLYRILERLETYWVAASRSDSSRCCSSSSTGRYSSATVAATRLLAFARTFGLSPVSRLTGLESAQLRSCW